MIGENQNKTNTVNLPNYPKILPITSEWKRFPKISVAGIHEDQNL